MKTKLLLLLFLLPLFVFAQHTQIGADIDGEAVEDESGVSLSLSDDGNIVAIGSRENDGNGNRSGHVRIYENTGGTWTQIGTDIDGEAANDQSGVSVSLNADGSTVAIGAMFAIGYGGAVSGHVRVYENTEGTWIQIGADIDGDVAFEQFGWSVSLSADGSIVAIGARLNNGNGNSSGRVVVYQYTGVSWIQLGDDIEGEFTSENSGYSVSLSADGSIVAIGAQNNSEYGSHTGQVRIYQYSGGVWAQIGDDINGETAGDELGSSVSLSSDGSIVAVGAPSNVEGSGPGYVRVYQNTGGAWVQIGADIEGEAADDELGASVSLSNDGSTVAIGAPFNDGNGSDAGHVRIYEYTEGTWTQIGEDIDGEAADDQSGHAISLSTDGNTIAIGAHLNDGNGTDAGHVRVYALPLIANFEADLTTVCFGSTVNFTNLSTGESTYSWTFEGGTPSASTEENPVVTYDTPGYYDVTLQVSDGDETETETKTEYIGVLETPDRAGVPDGDSSVCTEQFYEYAIYPVLYAQDYEWELSPSNAGSLMPNDTSAQFIVADDWTGDFTISVRATNMCGDGDWSDSFEGTVYASPTAFNLMGGGGFCLNGDGAEITLDGSETDIDYELYLDGIATGNIVEGTGSEISFGLITNEGYYTCVASNDNCVVTMNEQIQVEILFAPLEPDAPTGLEIICQETSSDYSSTGADDADSYEWELSPEEAGTITAEGLDATVEWNATFTGIALISLFGINDCGAGNSSNALEVSVGEPNPVIEGQYMVCDWSEEVYEVADNEESTYTWEVTGGVITEGQGSFIITASWEGEGSGSVYVSEITTDGCEGSSELFDVTIDDCTGVEDNPENQFSVNPNPVNDDLITVYTGTRLPVIIQIMNTNGITVTEFITTGTSSQINISIYPAGIYLLKATYNQKTEAVIKFLKN